MNLNANCGIAEIRPPQLAAAAEVIRTSFATVAKEFNLTKQNCPSHTSFATTPESLRNHFECDRLMYGLYDEIRLAGYVSLSKVDEYTYELHNLAVLPEYRHNGRGKQLLDFCKAKVKELGGSKIILSIIDENDVLKNWYADNGFVYTGCKWFKRLPFTVGFMEWEI